MSRPAQLPWVLGVAACCAGTACPDPPPAVEAATETVVPVSPAERAEIVADVQHLLQEVLRGQVAEDRLLARHAWQGAWDRFDAHLLADLRAREPATALQAEYAFGVVADAVDHGRRADESIRWLDGVLQAQRDRILRIDGEAP